MNIQKYNYEGSPISFDFLNSDTVYVNATEMAKKFDKKVNDFTRLESTQEYLKALDECYGNSRFTHTVKGNHSDGREQGTWFHRKLALRFAQWLNARFAVWVDDIIEQFLINGSVSPSSHPLYSKEQFLETNLENLQYRLQDAERVISSKDEVNTILRRENETQKNIIAIKDKELSSLRKEVEQLTKPKPKRVVRPKIPQETVQKLIDIYLGDAKLSKKEAADMVGVSSATASYILRPYPNRVNN